MSSNQQPDAWRCRRAFTLGFIVLDGRHCDAWYTLPVPKFRLIPLVPCAMAFVSGASALAYQVAWVKMLALTLGNTTIASAAVIGGFMGGMGIGARLYEFFPPSISNHYRRYGLIEFAIAATAAIVTPLFSQLPQLYMQSGTGMRLLGHGEVLPFAAALLILLVPSALMGATFPALCAALIRSMRGVSQFVGIVYGYNTLGAATGALLTGFMLIEQLGIRSSVFIGILGNLTCALTAFTLSRREMRTDQHTSPSPSNPQATPIRARTTKVHMVTAAVLFGSGIATMAYEMFWIRILKYVVGNSTYAMSLVVTIFLIGLGLGGLIHRRLGEKRQTAGLLAWTQVATAISSLFAVGVVSWVLSDPAASRHFSILSFQVQMMPWWKSLAITASLSVAVLLPPTLFMGLSFPLGSTLLVECVPTLGRDLGKAYLIANTGSIVGVFLGALVLLPGLGMMSATKVVAVINMLLAGLVLAGLDWRSRPRVFVATAVAATLCLALFVVVPTRLAFRGEYEGPGMSRLLFWQEDEVATVKVLQHPAGEARAMTIDGYVIGSSRAQRDAVVHKQLMLAHLPMALRPHASRVLTVGLGSATTLNALGAYDKIEILSCVEISRAVVAGARFFEEGIILDDPRTRIQVDDAVHVLLHDTTSYDLIISDCKQNFQYSGNASILSREYYAYALARLGRDGLFVQWIPMNFPPRAFRIVLRTFIDVFPEASVYYYTPDLLLFVGGRVPTALPDSIPYDAFDSSGAREDLRPFDIDDVRQVLTGRVCGAKGLKTVLDEGEINSWDRPLMEFIPYKEFRIQDNAHYNFLSLDLLEQSRDQESDSDPPPVPSELEQFVASSNELRLGFLEVFRTGRADVIRGACLRAQAINPPDSRPAIILRRIRGGIRNLLSPGSAVPPATAQ